MGIEITKEVIKEFLEAKGEKNVEFETLKDFTKVVNYDHEFFGRTVRDSATCEYVELSYLKQRYQVDRIGTVKIENVSIDAVQAMFNGLKPKFEKRGDYHGYRGHGKYLYHKGDKKEENELILFLI